MPSQNSEITQGQPGSLERVVRYPDATVYVRMEYRQGKDVTVLMGPYANGDLRKVAEIMSSYVDMREGKNVTDPVDTEILPNETEKNWRHFRDSMPTPKTEDA